MTGTVFTIAGWLAAAVSGWAALSCAARLTAARVLAARNRLGEIGVPAAGWVAPGLLGGASLALLGLLGALPVLPAALLALCLLGASSVPLVRGIRQARAQDEGGAAGRRIAVFLFWGLPRTALSLLWADLRLPFRSKGGDSPAATRPQAVPRQQGAPSPAAAPAQAPPAQTAPAAREVPPAREDPALAPVPHPGEVAAGLADANVEVPEPFRQLADWIAGFEPETDDEQSRFLHGCAAGKIAVAEAWQAHGENMVSGIGLDPSYGGAIFDLADSEASSASDAILVDRRYHVIYSEIKQAVVNGLHLPHRARQWFSGGSQQDDAGESAA